MLIMPESQRLWFASERISTSDKIYNKVDVTRTGQSSFFRETVQLPRVVGIKLGSIGVPANGLFQCCEVGMKMSTG